MHKLFGRLLILLFFSLGCRTGLIFAQDINIDMYINNWQKSLPVASHGTMTERFILTPGDPLNPSKPGAVLSICKRFSRGILESHVVTHPLRLSGEQEILYIVRGKGRIEAGMQKEQLIEGTAVLIPPVLEFTLTNECEEPLELLLLIEPFPANKTPRKDILARNYHNLPVNAGGHWSHIVRGFFSSTDGLGVLDAVLVVSIDGMNIGEPHSHVPGTEEVWYQLKGESILFFGKEIRKQKPGDAYMIPPNNKVPHSNINPTNEPMQWFYFAKYGK